MSETNNAAFDITAILTANLSDPTLTEMPVVQAGTYNVAIDKCRIIKELKEGQPNFVFRYGFKVLDPAKKHNSNDIWPTETLVTQQLNLVPTGKMTQDQVVRSVASFVQACGTGALLNEQERAEFNALSTPGEMPVPRYDGKVFKAKVTVKPDNDGNPRNNIIPVLAKA